MTQRESKPGASYDASRQDCASPRKSRCGETLCERPWAPLDRTCPLQLVRGRKRTDTVTGDAMRRLITIALGLLIAGLWITGHAVTSAQPGIAAPPPPGGMYIQVPRAGGYVWIPLDAAGNPQVPGGSPSTGQDMGPSAPATPPAPSAPGVPSQPTPGSWGFLQAEVLPADAQISIDGRGVGTAQQQFVALAPGLHRVE